MRILSTLRRILGTSFALWALVFSGIFVGSVRGQERAFFGNLHSHTSYSDGLERPRDAYRYARDIARLDFLALTEHNHSQAVGSDRIGIATNNKLYNGSSVNSLIRSARDFTVDGRFVALYGQEYSVISRGNHMNVFEIPNVVTAESGRFDQLVEFLNKNENLDSTGLPAIVMFNHPANKSTLGKIEYGLDDFGGEAEKWVEKLSPYVALMQMVNGPGQKPGVGLRSAAPAEAAYKKFLRLGFRIAPTADQDNHKTNWGNATNARTAIVTTQLTRAALLKAIRDRHVYATEDKNLSIIFRVNGRLCGDILAPTEGEAQIEFAINDSDEPSAKYEIEVWRGTVGGSVAKLVTSVETNAGVGRIEDVALSGSPEFFYFKVIQATIDGDDEYVDEAWTSPVWFDTAPAHGVTPVVDNGIGESLPNLLASRRSQIYHTSDACLDAKKIKSGNKVTGAEARKGRILHEDCPRLRR